MQTAARVSVPLRPARLVTLDWMLEQAANGQHESAGPNRSPLIDRINRYAGVPLGSAYCASAIKYGMHVAAGVDDFGGPAGASVEQMYRWAADRGYVVTRPEKGDVGAWYIDADSWADHAISVARVTSWARLFFTVTTVEANTSSGNTGSQSEGGGFYVRQRTFRRGAIKFVRDPRLAKKDPYAKKGETAERAEKRLETLRAWIIARHREGRTWAQIKDTSNWREYRRRGGK